jgi:hypothetical protein
MQQCRQRGAPSPRADIPRGAAAGLEHGFGGEGPVAVCAGQYGAATPPLRPCPAAPQFEKYMEHSPLRAAYGEQAEAAAGRARRATRGSAAGAGPDGAQGGAAEALAPAQEATERARLREWEDAGARAAAAPPPAQLAVHPTRRLPPSLPAWPARQVTASWTRWRRSWAAATCRPGGWGGSRAGSALPAAQDRQAGVPDRPRGAGRPNAALLRACLPLLPAEGRCRRRSWRSCPCPSSSSSSSSSSRPLQEALMAILLDAAYHRSGLALRADA